MPDRLPQLIYSNFLPRGSFERRMRNMGLGLDLRCSVCRSDMPNVKSETKSVGNNDHTETTTPLGTLHSKRRTKLTFQLPGGSWAVEHPVKRAEDLEIVKFMIEDTTYEPYYDDYLQLEAQLEGDGVVTVGAAYTPLMRIIVEFMGYKTFALTHFRQPEAIDEVVKVLDRKYLEMYKIIAESPAEIVRIGDNIDEVLMPRKMFEKYCLPYYDKYSRILQKAGKKVTSHLDGRLWTLRDLIGRTRLDAIEAFTPPPTGNLPISEARKAWEGKALWLNFPEVVFLGSADEIRTFTLDLMREMGDGSGYILSITEDIHPDHYRKAIETLTTTVQEHGQLPLRTDPKRGSAP
jgi:uroporphyrinogen-III decarboxylase